MRGILMLIGLLAGCYGAGAPMIAAKTQRDSPTVESPETGRKLPGVPKPARRAYHAAQRSLKRGALEEAEGQLEQAVEVYPAFALAWRDLGRLRRTRRRTEEARVAYRQAIEVKPDYWEAYYELGEMAFEEGRWEETAARCRRAIQLNPEPHAPSRLCLAFAELLRGRLTQARANALITVSIDAENFPSAHQVLAQVAMAEGDLEVAGRELRLYLETAGGEVDERLGQILMSRFDAGNKNSLGATLRERKSRAEFDFTSLPLPAETLQYVKAVSREGEMSDPIIRKARLAVRLRQALKDPGPR